ncbi:taurine dehydrogenase large subunit [Bradyrhizobium sp. R2.2-H]|jgi:taurine dehydrogenase large subunit|uniref:NAD(P)/FAD-dependent oxidoreductase n=1 Tax=unclassified Bradyrhizobium TaxID=2631580 RepID=UPI001045B0F3|nr:MULTISPECIES: FAD-binding oxidoreductase [unclassified Bradyrhizobium]TCU64294.1 taurine dehydrogenase large subunit [Bradyrhizobium sp. Y-H1]TCU66322.1 taurine dehydrogenase large subunit [Bradyrhizobium sp. R2.2-H]
MNVHAAPPAAAYDPHYDPLVSSGPGRNRQYAPTYWIATAGTPPPDDGPIMNDTVADVAIIGSGYTGLACAIFLAREYGIKAVVLEANRVAWGCSTRNGGQAQNASGRLTRSQWIKRWGLDTARRMHAEITEGFETFEELVRASPVDCEPQRGGHLYIAHRRRNLDKIAAESKVLNELFGYATRVVSHDELRRDFVDEAEAVGAVHEPLGTGVHPARLAFGYLRMARDLGVRVHTASPVQRIERHEGAYLLRTPGGTVRAAAVGIATGAYTSLGLTPELGGRCMPILSNSLVTRPLTRAEIDATGFRTRQVITDTRTLRFYYRLLPDNRLQIGSRSAITGADAAHDRHLQLLIGGLHRKFPPLEGIEIDYSWWGWVDVSHDMMPRIFRPDAKQKLVYALGYGGNGVSYSAQAGRRMAQMLAGKTFKGQELPIFTSPLPTHPFAPFRRLGQRMLYHWYHLRDEAR